jgi:hypothetical protein
MGQKFNSLPSQVLRETYQGVEIHDLENSKRPNFKDLNFSEKRWTENKKRFLFLCNCIIGIGTENVSAAHYIKNLKIEKNGLFFKQTS